MIAGSLLFFACLYRIPISDADEGIIADGAERIMRGQIPYRDFFSELGPASFYLQAAIFRVVGESLTAIRMTAWVLGGILSGIVYLLSRRLLSRPAALVPTAAFTMICYPYAYRISHHWWGNLFLLLSILFLAGRNGRRVESEGNPGKVHLGVAGALVAFTLLAMQSKGVWAVVMGAAYLILAGRIARGQNWSQAAREGLKRSFWFLTSWVAVIILSVAYFQFRGALGAWVEDNFLFLFTNYRPYVDVPQSDPWLMVRRLASIVQQQPSLHFVLYLAGYLFFAFIGPVVAFGGAAWRLRRDRSLNPARRVTLLLFLLLGIGAFLSEIHSPDFVHLVWGAPLMLILLTFEWREAVHSRRTVVRRLATAGAVFALMLMISTAGRKAANALKVSVPVETRRGTLYVAPEVAGETRRIIDDIQTLVPPGGETFFFPYHAELYFLTSARNPTRYDVLLDEFHSIRQIDEAISTLQARRPAYIFDLSRRLPWTIRPHFPDDQPDVTGPSRMERELLEPQTAYTRANEVAGMQVWVLKR
ncbi:MAG: hypothetical protein ACE145_15985 [Terriglobia bacterium]